MIISDSESIRMRLERLHSFSQIRTIDLPSNHVIRHTVLSLCLHGVTLVNISHNADSLLPGEMHLTHAQAYRQTRDTQKHASHVY